TPPDDTPPGGAPPSGGDGPPPPSGDREDRGAPAADRPAAPGDGVRNEIPEPEAADGPGGAETVAAAAAPHPVPLLEVPGVGEGAAGRRSRSRTARGRVTGARRPAGRHRDPHVTATLLAAAPHQRTRGRSGPGLVLRPGDLRESVREGREGNLVLFVVDASGSMAARRRMATVKTAVLSLLLDAYQRPDKVGMITLRGRGADLALPPTSSVEAGAPRLRALPTGGRTPLAAGLLRAAEVLRAERLRDPARRPLLVIVTDGRATDGRATAGGAIAGGEADRAAALLAGTAAIVVDCEDGPVRLGLAGRLAARLGARLVPLGELGGVVRSHRRHEHRKAARHA